MAADGFYFDDTRPEVQRRLVEHWRGMTPLEKCALVSSASRAVHCAHLAGLRLRHPEASAYELELRSAIARLGREAVSSIVGEGNLPPDG